MIPETRIFLTKLAALLEEHQATFFYTADDDGIHVALRGEKNVKIGYGRSDEIREILTNSHFMSMRQEHIDFDCNYCAHYAPKPGMKLNEDYGARRCDDAHNLTKITKPGRRKYGTTARDDAP